MAARRGRNQNKRARFVVTGALCIAMLSPLVLVSAAGATTGTTYSFTLDGSSTFVAGNTKVVSTGSTATGTATVIVSGSGSNQTLTISGTYSGLEGTATSVVIGSPQNSTTGTLLAFAGGITTTGGSSGTFGPQTAFSSLGSELAAGELTIGLESTAFPNGEIGGSNPAAPQLPPDASKTYFVGSSSANYVITTTGNPAPTLALTGALPSGVTFSTSAGNVNTTSGFFSGRPAAGTAGSYPVTLTASNGLSPDAVQHITLVVEDTPSITSTSGTSFVFGSNGSFTVKTVNDPNPSISESGALPAGVRFVDNRDGTATLSGSPGTGTVGSYPITITAADDLATEATQSFTLTVAKADQSVAFVGAPSTAVYGGQYFPETSFGPGTAVSISVDPSSAPGSCVDDPGSVSFTGLGTCVLDADRAANADWNAAPEAQVSIVVGPASSVGRVHLRTHLDQRRQLLHAERLGRWFRQSARHLARPGLLARRVFPRRRDGDICRARHLSARRQPVRQRRLFPRHPGPTADHGQRHHPRSADRGLGERRQHIGHDQLVAPDL